MGPTIGAGGKKLSVIFIFGKCIVCICGVAQIAFSIIKFDIGIKSSESDCFPIYVAVTLRRNCRFPGCFLLSR